MPISLVPKDTKAKQQFLFVRQVRLVAALLRGGVGQLVSEAPLEALSRQNASGLCKSAMIMTPLNPKP